MHALDLLFRFPVRERIEVRIMLDKLRNIKLLAMDVDGTLTDGSMIFCGSGEAKVFSVADGLGIRIAGDFGLRVAWITGNKSQVVVDRARSLDVTDVYTNSWHKPDAIADLCERYSITPDEVAYIGDDLNDLPAFEFCGVTFAPSSAAEEIRKRADVVTSRPGGGGAVREAIETILKARGEWEEAVDSFFNRMRRASALKEGPEAVA